MRANGRASGPVLTSRFLFVPDHSAAVATSQLGRHLAYLLAKGVRLVGLSGCEDFVCGYVDG